MGTLQTILVVTLYVAGILLLLTLIIAIIQGVISTFITRKNKKEFEAFLSEALAETLEECLKEEEAKGKTTKKAKKSKETTK